MPGSPTDPRAPSPRPDRVEGRLRVAAVWGALALALVLLGAAVASYAQSLALSRALAAGHQRMIEAALIEALPPGQGPPDAARLAEVLERQQAQGLRLIEVQGPEGRVLARAGEPAAEGEDRLRASLRPPPGLGRPGGPASAMGGPAPSPEAPGANVSLRPPPRVQFEFEPLLARELRRTATLNLALSLSVAAAMVAGALALRRVSRRAAQLAERLERERHLAALGEMSAVLAHELRNPLASLKGNAQLLVEVLESPRQQERARWLVTEAARMEALTEDLLGFARAGGGQRREVDPHDVVDEVLRELEPQRLTVVDEGLPRAWPLDPMRLHQALMNLARNALQAAEQPPPELRASREGDELVFSLRDHGPGLPPDVPPEALFEAFRTTRTRGTGLGLAVVRRVADLHGGRVEAEDAPGGGARFTLRIPREPT